MTVPFTHLHVHTEYSLLDGFGRIPNLIRQAKSLGMDSLAITDHGVLFGAVDFYKACLAEGIKPIIGCEVYVAPRRMDQKEAGLDTHPYHLILLAENNEGYRNLSKIVSEGYLRGFYYKPRVDHDVLRKYHKGIIALSACIAGEIPRLIIQGQMKEAEERCLLYQDIFGKDNFFLEIQNHQIREEVISNNGLYELSEKLNIPLVATNDCHYVMQSDAAAHDVLLCIQTNSTLDDEDRMRFPNDSFYLKSSEEMIKLFPEKPEAIENSHRIAERCQVHFDLESAHLPEFELPKGFNSAGDYVRKLCYDGLKERYDPITPEIKQRAEYELGVIHSMGFDNYFLVVWDFIKYAKDHGIPVGPGRGSAAGSLVAYALDITTLDPLKYQLIFERFLNPDRVTMPDIDCDFCYERRQEVIDYVIRKYGKDRVAQIITFGTMAARGAVKDVGRVMNMPYAAVDKVAKEIPNHPGHNITIKEAKKENPELQKMADNDPQIDRLLSTAEQLEGLERHASTHAAGIVISDAPLTEYVPLYLNGDAVTTQFPMTQLEDLGLIKMDFLGLRTLTVIHDAVENIYLSKHIKVDINAIDQENPKVYEMLSRGETLGVFQLESAGMINFMRELQPQHFEDIIAGISLYRPGPMDQIPRYIENKKHPENIEYLHPLLKPILEVTYGCMVYQEQVMQIFRDLAGFSMGRSDLVRRAMSKKKTDVMDHEGQVFIHGEKDENGNVTVPGAVANGVPENVAEEIYSEMKDFAKYAFNKSHAAAYAVVAYQTAWLKCYYPQEFMAALMSSVMDNEKKIAKYIDDCRRMKIKVLPPDVNISRGKFTVVGNDICFGLGAVKGLGDKPIQSIISAREQKGNFTGFRDFCEKVDLKSINRRVAEGLIASGAFDFTGIERARMLNGFADIMQQVQSEKEDRLSGQMSLIDMGELDSYKGDYFPEYPPFTQEEKLSKEKEAIGLYVSGHPLEKYQDVLKSITNFNSGMLESYDELVSAGIRDGGMVQFGGLVDHIRIQQTKKGDQMAFVTMEDIYGRLEIIVFPKVFAKYRSLIKTDNALIVRGKINYSEEMDISIISEKIGLLDQVKRRNEYVSKKNNQLNVHEKENNTYQPEKNHKSFSQRLILNFRDRSQMRLMKQIKPILQSSHGETPVILILEREKQRLCADKKLWVSVSDDLISGLQNILGKDKVRIR